MHSSKKLTAMGVSAIFSVIAVVGFVHTYPIKMVRETTWAVGIYEGKSIETMRNASGVKNPVMKASDVTDVKAMFVADPFLIKKDSKWFMFFEVFNELSGQGDIGMSMSDDGKKWVYQKIVLDEPFHISYPHVFEYNNEVYMIPESAEANELRLYKAEEFPYKWKMIKILLKGSFGDHEILQKDNVWWIFVGAAPAKHNVLRLFYADSLFGEWKEHPVSPIVKNDANKARPGGRIVFENGKIYRFGQDCAPSYGNALNAFEIVTLNKNEYKEIPATFNPILKTGKNVWNRHGMHHMDAHKLENGEWIASVDGYKKELVIKIGY